MKIGNNELTFAPDPAKKGGARCVRLELRTWGVLVGGEVITADQARQLAREIDQAADQAEGGAL